MSQNCKINMTTEIKEEQGGGRIYTIKYQDIINL